MSKSFDPKTKSRIKCICYLMDKENNGNEDYVLELIKDTPKDQLKSFINDCTLFHIAAANDYPKVINYYLDIVEIDPDIRDKYEDYTPLHLAALENNYNIVDMLIKRGADVNKKTIYGKTVLMFAMENNEMDIIQRILSVLNVDINYVNDEGNSAVKYVLENDYISWKLKKILLTHQNIDYHSKIYDGMNLLEYIMIKYYYPIGENLHDYFMDNYLYVKCLDPAILDKLDIKSKISYNEFFNLFIAI